MDPMLTQTEADRLIALPKKTGSSDRYAFPKPGSGIAIPLTSLDDRVSFLLDVTRGRIRLSKCTFQNRYKQVIILVRLDVDGPPHTNPSVVTVPVAYLQPFNGAEVPCPHLHLFVEGFGDRWAIPAPSKPFSDPSDLFATLAQFMQYCNVVKPPLIDGVLF
jgi:hypothetical protein